MQQSNLPASIPSLTGVRAIAALSVVLFHFTLETQTFWGIPNIFRNGWLGVDLFFVLSGFIIHHVYRTTFAKSVSRSDYGRFLWFRFARIYPVHIVTLGAALGFSLALTALNFQPAREYNYIVGTISSALLTHAWFGIPGPNGVSWSVSAEWFAYLLYPALCWLSMQLSFRQAGIILLFLLGVLHFGSEHNALLRVVPEFCLGMCAYGIAREFSVHRSSFQWVGLLIACATLGLQFMPGTGVVAHAVLFALIIISLVQPRDLLARILSTRVCVYLGEISYSLYLIHTLVRSGFVAGERHIPFMLDGFSRTIVSIALSLIAAAALYHFVELPARAYLRKLSDSRIVNPRLQTHIASE